MKLNVAQLLKAAVGTTREYELEETFTEVEGQPITQPVKVQLHLTRINDGLLARGDVETALQSECSRCVELADQPIRFHFEETFRPTIDIASGQLLSSETEPSEPIFIVDANHMMDIDEVVRQGIVIETPMHPLCQPQCQGLCVSCGANLNQGPCGCKGDAPSGSLAALLKDLVPIVTKQ